MYKKIASFILRHALMHGIICAVMVVFTGIMMASINFPIPAGISFGGFLIAAVRFFTYKNGNVPIFMRDKTWESIKREEEDEEAADERFHMVSAKVATVSYIVGWIAFAVAIILEALWTIGD